MRALISTALCGTLLAVTTLSITSVRATSILGLCELREEDGLQCECRDSEANCEVTKPLVAFGPVAHRSHAPPVETAKRRRDARTINTLVLRSPRDESFLGKFPADIFEEPLQFKNISMTQANLGELASYAVSGSRYLRELTLAACGISGLLQSAIAGLENLRRMDLSRNQISRIRAGSLRDLPELRQLIIAHSQVDEIEPHAFVELTSLEKLSLKDNELREVDNRLFTGLNNLREVELNFNYIERLDNSTFVDLPHLQRIDLRGNQLTVISPRTFRNLPHLAYLSLNYNELTHLPVSFLMDSPNLKELNLGRNKLQAVTLDTLRGLRVIRPDFILDLRSNPLNCSCEHFYLTELRKRRMAEFENELEDPPEFVNLQCRRLIGEHLEPRQLDEAFFLMQACEADPSLSEHLVDDASALAGAAATGITISSKSLLFAHVVIAVASGVTSLPLLLPL